MIIPIIKTKYPKLFFKDLADMYAFTLIPIKIPKTEKEVNRRRKYQSMACPLPTSPKNPTKLFKEIIM